MWTTPSPLPWTDQEDQVLEIDRDMICHTLQGKPIKPKTLGQKKYVDAIRQKMIVFGLGPAGTGKTYLAMAMAITAFKNNEVGRIMTDPAPLRRERSWAFCPEISRARLILTCAPSTMPCIRSWGRRVS